MKRKWADSVARLGPGPTCDCLDHRDWFAATNYNYLLLGSSSDITNEGVVIRHDEVVVCKYKTARYDGTIPDTNFPFTARVDPVSDPPAFTKPRILVDPPGTAPGSTSLILKSVQHHLRVTPAVLIIGQEEKKSKFFGSCSPDSPEAV